MNKLIFHIGYHKSASTFLQKKVFPKLNLNYAFLNRRALNQIKRTNFTTIDFWSEVKPLLNKSELSVTLISHEELSGHPEGVNKKIPFTVAENIKKISPEAKIIIIIRNQFSYLSSYYTFRVSAKGLEFRSLNEFLKAKGKVGLFQKLEYSRLISYYHSKFGKHNVLVVPMELITKDFKRFTNELSNFIELEEINIKQEEAQNVSTKKIVILNFWKPLNYMFSAFLKGLNFMFRPKHEYPFSKIRFSYYRLKRFITKKMNKRFKQAKKIDIKSIQNYDELYRMYSNDNQITQKLINFDLRELNYPL